MESREWQGNTAEQGSNPGWVRSRVEENSIDGVNSAGSNGKLNSEDNNGNRDGIFQNSGDGANSRALWVNKRDAGAYSRAAWGYRSRDGRKYAGEPGKYIEIVWLLSLVYNEFLCSNQRSLGFQ